MSQPFDAAAMWNERYAASDLWGAEPNAMVATLAADLPPGRALDLGSGTGRNAIWLGSRGHRVTAVDISSVATERARAAARAAGVDVEFITADLSSWVPPSEAFELVVLAYLHLPESSRRLVHRRAAAALAPGGRLLLVAHHLDNLAHGVGGPQSPDVLMTEAELADDFAALNIIRNEVVLRPVEREGESGEAIDLVFEATKPV